MFLLDTREVLWYDYNINGETLPFRGSREKKTSKFAFSELVSHGQGFSGAAREGRLCAKKSESARDRFFGSESFLEMLVLQNKKERKIRLKIICRRKRK